VKRNKIVKILLLPQNLEKLRICEHTNEKEEKNSSFPKSGNILHSFYAILKSKKNVFLKKN
jgi:hypothetical protein